MIARLSEHNQQSPDPDPGQVTRQHAWLAAQPGFCGGYDLFEPGTGHALSITMWQDDDALAAADRIPRPEAEPLSEATVRLVRVTAVF